MESFIFFACLIIVCMAFYLLGRSDGARDAVPLSDEAQLELEKHKYDAFYAHERWLMKTKEGRACYVCTFMDIPVDVEPCNSCRRNPAGAQDAAGEDHFRLINSKERTNDADL